jgi:hypothetical protein
MVTNPDKANCGLIYFNCGCEKNSNLIIVDKVTAEDSQLQYLYTQMNDQYYKICEEVAVKKALIAEEKKNKPKVVNKIAPKQEIAQEEFEDITDYDFVA